MNRDTLRTEKLTLRIGRRTLIDRLSLSITPGELWCVLGANGSGKTTLLHTLAGLRDADAGAISLHGRPLLDWSAVELARIRGLLPQALHDSFAARALEVVLMGRHPHLARWRWEGEDDIAIAHAALQAVDAESLALRDVTTLSGGERQRVGIATVLAQDPQLILLDEPTAHLDLHHQIAVLNHVRRLAREANKAVVLSIHDLQLAHRFASHALLLFGDGRVKHGPVDDVMVEAALSEAYRHPVLRRKADGRAMFLAG
jgi:iron complex transport system ATP-binding protein